MSASTNPEIDEVIDGRYIVERPLGEGGMGTVFLARHTLTGRRVALKWVESSDKPLRQRLLREARAIAKVSHRSVVGVLDAGEHRNAVYIVLEYLSGENLRTYSSERTLAPNEAVKLLMPAIEGVAAAHQAGILHRDLKPENLYVCKDADGHVFDTKVLDFGVAKQVLRDVDAPLQTALTQAGHIVGTPQYMAPEQISHNPQLDERTDVYAMGIVLYELLTGHLPYETRELKALLLDIIKAEFPSPSRYRDGLPAGLCKVVMTALSSMPSARYSSMAAFGQALEPWADGRVFEPPRKLADPSDDTGLDAHAFETMHRSGAVPLSHAKTKIAPAPERATITRQGNARATTPIRGLKKEAKSESFKDIGPISVAARTPLQASSAPPIQSGARFSAIIAMVVLSMLASFGVWYATRSKHARLAESAAPIEASEAIHVVKRASSPEPNAEARAAIPQGPAQVTQPSATALAPAPEVPQQKVVAEPAPTPRSASRVASSHHRSSAAATATQTAPSTSTPVEVKTRAGTFGAKDF